MALLCVTGSLAAAMARAQQPQAAGPAAPGGLPYHAIAARIVAALRPSPGERAILRADSTALPGLVGPLRSALERAGVSVETMPLGEVPDFETRLTRADIYVWLPTAPTAGPTAAQREALGRWLDSGRGREIHFHWTGVTTAADGIPTPAPPRYERMLTDALTIDYRALSRTLAEAAALLRTGEVHVTTPEGTDLRFRIGDRPIVQQDGDASAAHLRGRPLRVDREVELPAGALRVAPLEETVNGTLVVPRLRWADTGSFAAAARDVRLEFRGGKVVRMTAASHEAEVRDSFLVARPALASFRELGIGFNPKLFALPGEDAIPSAGYGAGMVRLSLGDNSELGGAVRGGAVLWLFFPNATVTVGRSTLVRRGRLVR